MPELFVVQHEKVGYFYTSLESPLHFFFLFAFLHNKKHNIKKHFEQQQQQKNKRLCLFVTLIVKHF